MQIRTLNKIYYRCGWVILLTSLMAISCGRQTTLNLIAVTAYLSFPLYIFTILFLIGASLGSVVRKVKEKNLVILSVATLVYLLFLLVSVTAAIEVLPVSDVFFVVTSLMYALLLVILSRTKVVKEENKHNN